MKLPLRFPYPLMESTPVSGLPQGDAWQYEPKWDGFRCLVFRDADEVRLQSKAGKPLERYFPEVVAHVQALGARRFVLDGELVVKVGRHLSFDDLLQRIHPAQSRIEKLSEETPAQLKVFDLLVDERGALRAALRARLKEGVVTVVDELRASEIKTKPAAELLRRLGANGKTLVVDVTPDEKFNLSARNIAGVRVVSSGRMTARDVMDAKRIIATRAAVERLEEVLG